MIKAAVFDVDGTLLDSMHIWKDAGARYLKTLGLEAEPNLTEILFPLSMEEGAVYLKRKYGITRTEECIQEDILGLIRDFYLFEAKLKPGVRDFLRELRLRNVRMVLTTAGEIELVQAAFGRLGVKEYFEKIFACSEFQTTKRESLVYQKCMDYLKCRPREVCVFEDVLHAIQSAKKTGALTVGVEDEVSIGKWEDIHRETDYYLIDFQEFDKFWAYIQTLS